MHRIWRSVKQNLQRGFKSATDLTKEYTKIGRIRMEIMAVKKEIEEKLIELGGRIYDEVIRTETEEITLDTRMLHAIQKLKDLEDELIILNKKLDQLKNSEDGSDSSEITIN
jgi:hypothetical protein